VNEYANFKVLLDDPADTPGLRFEDYASALAEIIANSRAEFAVGIFGSWGSGKTTLMHAVERLLKAQDDVVPVWFTAWRYEKEPHLIVPLLDVLREALEKRAATEADEHGTVKRTAAAIARAGRAFLAGLTVSARLPGVDAQWKPESTIAALKADDNVGAESLSFYHAGFVMLRDAIREFSAGGTRRVVVFVDDLDRCLPANALELLESMKLFFDVEGFVFVVGLDQEIAERAVALKYGRAADEPEQRSAISGTDYVKKIFQVPFTLPAISTDQLQEYLTSVANNADLSPEQHADFEDNVRRHLRYIHGGDSVNPREIKRLINTYTLQLKMLSARLGGSLDPNIVLALQCMGFRPEWRELYDHLAADPQQFQSTLRDVVQRDEAPDAVWLSGARVALPGQFLEYLRRHAGQLLEAGNLRSYVSAAESTHSTDPTLLELQTTINRIRQTTHGLATGESALPTASTQLTNDVSRLIDTRNKRVRGSVELESTVSALESIIRNLITNGDAAPDEAHAAKAAAEELTPLLDALDSQLRELRRRANVGAYR
jgi:energy-coupling factor transporter ATP-binding protein EcfA2